MSKGWMNKKCLKLQFLLLLPPIKPLDFPELFPNIFRKDKKIIELIGHRLSARFFKDFAKHGKEIAK